MRTNEAKRTRDKALKDAKNHGHDVALISKGGALELYGCYNCNDVMDIWDSPAIVNGPLPHRACTGIPRKRRSFPSLLRRAASKYFLTWVKTIKTFITNLKEGA